MATRKTSPNAKPQTLQKQRAEGENAKARAEGGGPRSQPAEEPPPPMASTGGRATPSNVRSSLNSRSSNSGRQAHGPADSTRARKS